MTIVDDLKTARSIRHESYAIADRDVIGLRRKIVLGDELAGLGGV